jgi:uncharacterized BrkB/YihY/UPF0761 family membrane protein
MGLVIGGGMLMLFGMLYIKHLVRTIMNEIWEVAAEKVKSNGKKTKMQKGLIRSLSKK